MVAWIEEHLRRFAAANLRQGAEDEAKRRRARFTGFAFFTPKIRTREREGGANSGR